MDSSDTTNGKIQPEPLPRRSTTYLIILILALQVIVALATYPFLPDIVPSHWNAAGQVDGYLPKWINSFLFPAISLALSALFIFIGNYLGKLRRNFWGGIRTPWTLASKSVPQSFLSYSR